MCSLQQIIAVGDRKILQQGSFDKLKSIEGYFSIISTLDDRVEASVKEDTAPLIQANAEKLRRPNSSTAKTGENRQTGDLTVYKYSTSLPVG